MAWPGMILLLYGAMNIVLGIYGFAHSHSVISLVAGGISGLLVIYAAFLAKTHPNYGYGLGALICLAMLGNFGAKMSKGGWLPPTMIASSAIVLLALIVAHFTAKPNG